MTTYTLKKTEKTPSIQGDIRSGKIEIIGRSFIENSNSFYADFRIWMDKFLHESPQDISVLFDIDYINTSSSLVFGEVIKNIAMWRDRKNVQIVWRYESDDISLMEFGEDLKAVFGDILILEEKV